MAPFPEWFYKNEKTNDIKTRKINVGGQIFEVFEDTCMNILNTKLIKCLVDHRTDQIIFIDRDPICFSAVLNFYRTGRLHTPPNICLAFFEEELDFWGIHEEFLEPCCWRDYHTFKNASNKLKKYSEGRDKNRSFSSGKYIMNFKSRQLLYGILTSGTNSVASMVNYY